MSFVTLACGPEEQVHDTAAEIASSGDERIRAAEAWLTGYDTWQRCELRAVPDATLQQVHCPVPNIPRRFVSIELGSCDAMIRTHRDAVETLAYAPVCTDRVVRKLTAMAQTTPSAPLLSDLAAAHLVRARRHDRPSDYARAFSAAERALKKDPGLVQARFNAALAEEGLGFVDEAIGRWTSLVRTAPDGWKTEAQEHARRLGTKRGLGHAVQWRINVRQLPDALAVRDREPQVLAGLIAPFRSSAQNYVEEEVLRDWAQAADRGNAREAENHLALAEAIASALEQLNEDRYLRDAVVRIRTARNPKTAAALRRGHRELAGARMEQRSLRGKPQKPYERAEEAFRAAGSPLWMGAALGRITVLTQSSKFDAAWRTLEETERAARRASYRHIVAKLHSARGYYFTVRGSYLQALAQYDAAQAIYARTGDTENLGNVDPRKIGLLFEVGDVEEAWRQILRRHSSADYTATHLLLGESARASVAIGEAGVGLRFQNAAVRFFEDELRGAGEERIPQLRRNLGIAFRARASIRAFAGDRDGAHADLLEAQRLIGDSATDASSSIIRGFQARLAEAKAHTLKDRDRAAAIAWLTQAIEQAEQTHYRTLLASLLVQRAEPHHQDGNRAAELLDLQETLEVLHAEADELRKKAPSIIPHDVGLWSAYFSRPQDAYRRLVQLLAESGDTEAAFNRAEEGRVYEPLHLAYQRADLPSAFSRWLQNRKPFELDEVRTVVPEGTYLLQYSVLDDRTYVWIIRHGESEWLALDGGNEAIAGWTAKIQEFADSRSDEKFREALAAPYEALFRKPLERVAQLHGGREPARLVIVPDRAMHGLPFAALGTRDDCILDHYRVTVAASATLYAFSLDQDRELAGQPPESVLLVGDPAFNGAQGIARGLQSSMPGLRIDRIAQIYTPRIRVEPLTREDATIPRFLDAAARGSIIHLAAHGVANPDVPSRSFFLLAPAGDGDSGALDAERLLRELRLQRTRLAVLAACSSAGGTAVGPDGLAPLVRPLAAAGVPGVIGTLWNVSAHQETEELLVRFHRHYSNGFDAADALRLAQLEMRKDADVSRNSPRAWGAFQMIGHASSPFPSPAQRQTRR